MLSPTKLRLPIFEPPKKCYNSLSPSPTPILSRFISLGYFLLLKLKMKLKWLHFADVAEFQEAVTDELKKVQNRNFRQLFINYTTAQKHVYMPMELILNKRKVCVFLIYLRFLKKSALKLLDHSVYNEWFLFLIRSERVLSLCRRL